ncbi:hypothetical protein GUB10_02720 [Salegentibacter sp. BLCTC]|uniref:hypothetical protein n=1 Tax=Salegentibacter sp. BLCTC TaxID=2697368 RepID=UPI00187B28FD|nr:hypothetical protein [Salegentibacter sp. BLCTC]MBE7639235.1 hypothetical protein [Salegentibacter sp. BLCTC]
MMTIDNRLLLFFLIFILILGVFLSVHYSYISADAPYYLSVARDISNGDIPYKDIYLSYTPIMMYLNTFIFEFFGGDVYKNFLIFQILIIVLSALVYYFSILKTFKLSSLTASSLALLLIISVLSSDGNYINLEVYSILFVFIAFFLLFQEKFILTGIFLALSFFLQAIWYFKFYSFLCFSFFRKG